MTMTRQNTQELGDLLNSTAIGCNVSGEHIIIQDNRIIIVLQGIDNLKELAEALTAQCKKM